MTFPARRHTSSRNVPADRQPAAQGGLVTATAPLAPAPSDPCTDEVVTNTTGAATASGAATGSGKRGPPNTTTKPSAVAVAAPAGAHPPAPTELMSAVTPVVRHGVAAQADSNQGRAELREDDVLTAREVSHLLRVNVKTIYEAAQAGTIPCVRLGRSFRFSRQAILASLQACKSASRRTG